MKNVNFLVLEGEIIALLGGTSGNGTKFSICPRCKKEVFLRRSALSVPAELFRGTHLCQDVTPKEALKLLAGAGRRTIAVGNQVRLDLVFKSTLSGPRHKDFGLLARTHGRLVLERD
ncbi:MAG: hypothetical protein CEN90_456 [Parcubacteria group bacterium Licking1014_17]|nr:MAG: hypothetical protein CEN90_456 [Parcubacteria group bacterium Licking1014_17]